MENSITSGLIVESSAEYYANKKARAEAKVQAEKAIYQRIEKPGIAAMKKFGMQFCSIA